MIEGLKLGALAVAWLALAMGGAAAQQIQSSYTNVNLDECTVIEADDFGARWACPGYKGIPVMIAEGDLRFFVSYGLKSTEEKAAEQTLPPFNYLGPRIEWRVSNMDGQWKPFATILRFFTSREEGEDESQVLVVTKVEEGATCHVAYIDALANPGANELARATADEKAPDFDCAGEPEIIGEFKAWNID
ncbi:MAG: hypothetical protein ACYC0C_04095 [Devosia sp.]